MQNQSLSLEGKDSKQKSIKPSLIKICLQFKFGKYQYFQFSCMSLNTVRTGLLFFSFFMADHCFQEVIQFAIKIIDPN